MNFDYIPLDQKVIDSYVNEFEKSRKVVLSKIRFDNGFENSVIALNFLNELTDWTNPAKVNIHHLAYLVAYDYLELSINHMTDERYHEILRVVNSWANAFKCAYDHSSSVNFSWAFRELLKEVKPLID